MIIEKDTFFVLTGGPGSGKTSIIDALMCRGVYCVPEAARDIIKAQLRIGGSAVPWRDARTFRELRLARDMHTYSANLERAQPVSFDRGVVDVLSYSRLVGLKDDLHLHKAVASYRYNCQVFVAPPWKHIYVNDAERKQTFEEAVATYDTVVRTYQAAGYALIELPRGSVEERVELILESWQSTAANSRRVHHV